MSVYTELTRIQQSLKAPKNQRNNFGGYNYRSCEDILEAVKPLLGEACLTITDEVKQIGSRYYVCATASLTVDGETISKQGWAREQDERKGMDESQLTGSASSYARKYALNGLFLIDDAKDADAMEPEERKSKKPSDEIAEKRENLRAACKGYAKRNDLSYAVIFNGVKKRPDYAPDDLEWLVKVTREFEEG